MSADTNLREIAIGDWVHINDDDLFAWRENHSWGRAYGTKCRMAQVTRVYDDSIDIEFQRMYDMSDFLRGSFTYSYGIYGSQVEVMNISENGGYSPPVAPYVQDVGAIIADDIVPPAFTVGWMTSTTQQAREGSMNG